MYVSEHKLNIKRFKADILDYMRKNLCEQTPKYEEMVRLKIRLLCCCHGRRDLVFKCKTVITAYGPVILKLLSNDLSPQQICTLIGFCNKNENDQINVFGFNLFSNTTDEMLEVDFVLGTRSKLHTV
jgi:hypothetical protein